MVPIERREEEKEGGVDDEGENRRKEYITAKRLSRKFLNVNSR